MVGHHVVAIQAIQRHVGLRQDKQPAHVTTSWVVLFRLVLSWLVQVLESVAGEAFSEKDSVFWGF